MGARPLDGGEVGGCIEEGDETKGEDGGEVSSSGQEESLRQARSAWERTKSKEEDGRRENSSLTPSSSYQTGAMISRRKRVSDPR